MTRITLLKNKRYLLLLPFAPGWIIPRIVGTLAFLAHPTWAGFVAILCWWLLVPLLWIVGIKGLQKLRAAYGKA